MRPDLAEITNRLLAHGLTSNEIHLLYRDWLKRTWKPGRIDEAGRFRKILSEPNDPDSRRLIAQTLADPMEIWGWPGRELYYIATYETAEKGVQSVIVKVWGEVTDAEIVSGGADAWRKGMLVWKKN